jgi:branched-chain amino acid transport system substrate-binding protein
MDNFYHYEAVIEDSMMNSAKAANIISKMINIDKIDAVITAASNVCNVIAPIAEKNKVIHIANASDPNVATGKYNFINWTQPEFQAKKMVETIADKGYKNVAIVILNQEGSIACGEALTEGLNNKGIKNEVVLFNTGTKDFRMDVKRMADKKIDLYVVMLYNPEISIFIKQLREHGVEADVTSIETFSFMEGKQLIEGSWYVDAATADDYTMKRIKEHNKSDATYAVGNMYDDIMLIAKAFEAADSKEQAIDKMLEIKEYNGITGHVEQDENGIFNSEAIVKKIVDGKIVISPKADVHE